MLGWALTFLVVALIAAALGFGGIAGASAGIAQILFFVFIALGRFFIVALGRSFLFFVVVALGRSFLFTLGCLIIVSRGRFFFFLD